MNEPGKLIALLSDFGIREHYVGAMKGVLATLAPEARVTDITHSIPHFDVTEGATTLALAAREFPAGTIFLAVVDPGVGSERRALAARTKDGSYWVGPDNGLFWPVFSERGLQAAHSLDNPELQHPDSRSTTFHGRDIFAPAAAHLARGVELADFGALITDPVRLHVPEGRLDGQRLRGHVQRVDDFGNVITSIGTALLAQVGAHPGAGQLQVRIGDRLPTLVPFRATYADTGAPQEALALLSSSGTLELAVNQGSFAGSRGARPGDEVEAEWREA